ncbi:NAD(P)H-dependent oxidoreductase [Streptomyces sp. L7]
MAEADGLIVVTPVFSASYGGLFKSFFDVLDKDALAGKPLLIAATGGSARHSLVLDHALRPLFPTSEPSSSPPGLRRLRRTGAREGLAGADRPGGGGAGRADDGASSTARPEKKQTVVPFAEQLAALAPRSNRTVRYESALGVPTVRRR